MKDAQPAYRRERDGLVSGKWVLLALLATVCAIPVVVWGVLRVAEADLRRAGPPLSWAQRSSWPSPPIKRTTLARSRSGFAGLRGGSGRWRDLAFSVPAAIEQATQRAAGLARLSEGESPPVHAPGSGTPAATHPHERTKTRQHAGPGAPARQAGPASSRHRASARPVSPRFAVPAVRVRLQRLADKHPDFFYPRYLLAAWRRLAGDADAAAADYRRAFRLAPAVIKLQYVAPGGEPRAHLHVGTIEVACDRVINGKLDQTLKLVYPDLTTDAQGYVYLPVFDTVYRFARLPQPAGYVAGAGLEGWFEFPGRIAAPRPIVVRRRPTHAASTAGLAKQ